MLIDDVTIKLKAGHGGRGKVDFQRVMMALGPTGGSGGRGGSIYFEGTSDMSALNQFRYKKEVAANDGEGGKMQNNDGENADDVILKIPVGTVIHNLTTGDITEINKIGEKILAVK